MKSGVKVVVLMVLLAGVPVARAVAQGETVPVQQVSRLGVVEEFSVLKADKSIRQGSYVRYHPPGSLSGVWVLETGAYERGLKEGEWHCFSEQFPWNKLVSKGTYRAGLPEGLWFYYHHKENAGPSKRATPSGKSAQKEYTVDMEDTTAVVKAKGVCVKGVRAGLWKYYNPNAVLVQAINHTSNKLLYWQPESGPAVSGEAALLNHPLLYVGGKAQLKWDLAQSLDFIGLMNSGKEGYPATLVFSVDSLGQQTSVELLRKTAPNKYEKLLLDNARNTRTRWLPQVANGKSVGASYQVLVTSEIDDKSIQTQIEPLGD